LEGQGKEIKHIITYQYGSSWLVEAVALIWRPTSQHRRRCQEMIAAYQETPTRGQQVGPLHKNTLSITYMQGHVSFPSYLTNVW